MRRRFHLHLPGLLFVALTIFVGFAAANRPNNLVVWAFGGLLALILVSGVISGSMMLRVRVSRLDTRRAAVGEPFEIRYLISNTSTWRAAYAIRVDEILEYEQRSNSPMITSPAYAWSVRVGPGESQVCDVLVWPERRGVMMLDRVRMTSFFPFGLMGRSVEIDQSQRVLVQPRVHPVRPWVLRTAVEGELGGIRLSRAPGPGEDFYSVREFRPGDSVRHIAWKRLGRSEDLLVVQRSSSAPPRVRIFLDLTIARDQLRFDPASGLTAEDLEERAIVMAASLVSAADQEGHEFGLTIFGFGDRPIPLRRGYWHRERVMATLAAIDLSQERTDPPLHVADDDERAAIIVIHAGRVETRRAPERAWHWSAGRIEELLEMSEPPSRNGAEQPTSAPLRRAPA